MPFLLFSLVFLSTFQSGCRKNKKNATLAIRPLPNQSEDERAACRQKLRLIMLTETVQPVMLLNKSVKECLTMLAEKENIHTNIDVHLVFLLLVPRHANFYLL